MNIDELVSRLRGKNYAEVARRAKFGRWYIAALATGKRSNPSVRGVARIIAAIDEIEAEIVNPGDAGSQ